MFALNSHRFQALGAFMGAALILLVSAGCPAGGSSGGSGSGNTNSNANENGNANVNDNTGGNSNANENTNSTNENDNGTGQPLPQDADGDGVNDATDRCPDTAPGATADANGCAPDQQNGDTDGDGVVNPIDECPNTPAGVEVDDRGCPVMTPVSDSDGDSVPDDQDQCPNTPGSVQVDENGCPISAPGTSDADEDGVNDDIDQCPDTPTGATVDANGCPDADGDGVADTEDLCADTPANAEVDNSGCPDSDGDGVNDLNDQCPGTPARTVVDETGCPKTSGGGGGGGGGGGSATLCGDGTRDPGEQCDDGNAVSGDGCSEACQIENSGTIPNDSCATPDIVTDDTYSFDTTGATTDSITETGTCANDIEWALDVWFQYVATCTGTATVSLCGSEYDTTAAVFEGGSCPTQGALQCNDDGCGDGSDVQSSRLTFPAVEGNTYLIRIGGYVGDSGPDSGTGSLTIFCGDSSGRGPASCGAGPSDCFTVESLPTCTDTNCCSTICGLDPYCCDVAWDGYCVEEGVGICGAGFNACTGGIGDCYSEHTDGSAGCEGSGCCQTVCEGDPFCCLDSWDEFCAQSAVADCSASQVCASATGSCFSAHATAGCSDQTCCESICLDDPFCCSGEWDATCVESAAACR